MTSANRCWRQLATGLCFIVFGLGGMVIALLSLPLHLFVRSEERRERIAKRTIHYAFRCFVYLMRALRVMTFEIVDRHRLLEPGQLIIANHPTLIDVVLLMSFIPNADCVVKKGLLSNPFTWGPVRAARYIVNDSPEAVIDAAKSSMARGNCLIIFPEGTRTTPGARLKLQRGAANIAIRTANKLRPVIIQCEPLTLTKHSRWHQVPKHRFHMRFRVMDPIDVEPYLAGSPSLKSRDLTNRISEHLNGEIFDDE